MGELIRFGSVENEEIVELPHAGKIRELSDFDRRLITNYIKMNGYREDISVRFFGDEFGDKYEESLSYRDATTDVLYNLFEVGWIPEERHFDFIFRKFKEADRIDDLTKWMKEWWEND